MPGSGFRGQHNEPVDRQILPAEDPAKTGHALYN